MADIKERLLNYLKISGMTKKDFSEKTGISLWNITGKSVKSELGGEQISKIIGEFPNISPDWLLLGKGEMYRQNGEILQEDSASYVKIPTEVWETMKLQSESLKAKDEQISRLINLLDEGKKNIEVKE